MKDEFEISDGLRKALSDVTTRERLEIPDAVDARLRTAARAPRGRRFRLRRVAVAAAAGLLLALGVWALGGRSPAPEIAAVAVAGDLDADGHVDIVDAYLLDRRLPSVPAAGDVDGDGRVDGADVLRLIERVVALSGGKG